MAAPRIDGYRFGLIEVDGRSYRKDVIIFPDRVRPNWWRSEGHALAAADLQEILAETPEILVVGLGAFSRMTVPEETRLLLQSRGIELKALPTKAACEVYNRLREDRRVVAALHLTC